MLVNAGKTAFKVSTFLIFAQTEADGNPVVSVGGACTWAPGCRRHRCPLKKTVQTLFYMPANVRMLSRPAARARAQTHTCVMQPTALCGALIESCERRKR